MHLLVNHPRHHRARLQVGEHALGVLTIRDDLTERRALRGVIDRPTNHGFRHRRGADRLRQTLLRQLGHHQREAAAFLAEHICGGNPCVREE
jgi:hypothetical protein